MAKYNEILVGRYNRFLQRFLSIKGDPPAPQLAGEISPQFQLDDAENLENRFPVGWRSYGLVVAVAAGGAGTRAAIRLHMPAGINVVAVIEKISSGSGSLADQPFLNRGPFGTGVLTTPLTGAVRDARMGTAASSGILSAGTPVATVGVTLGQIQYPIGGTSDMILDEHQEIALLPNDAYTLYSNVINQALGAVIWWRERALEEGELT